MREKKPNTSAAQEHKRTVLWPRAGDQNVEGWAYLHDLHTRMMWICPVFRRVRLSAKGSTAACSVPLLELLLLPALRLVHPRSDTWHAATPCLSGTYQNGRLFMVCCTSMLVAAVLSERRHSRLSKCRVSRATTAVGNSCVRVGACMMVDVTAELLFSELSRTICRSNAVQTLLAWWVRSWLPFDSKHALSRSKSLSLHSHPARLAPEVLACEVKTRRATMSKVGILPVPAGKTAEFDGFSELQVRILVVYVVTSVLATVGLILRFYTGACLNQRRLGPDACTSAFSSQLCNNAPHQFSIHRFRSFRFEPRSDSGSQVSRNTAHRCELTRSPYSSHTRIMGSLPGFLYRHAQGLPMWFRKASLERH